MTATRGFGWREALSATTPIVVFGTLLCCGVPILLVVLGAGSVVAAVVSAAPWLADLSRHKAWVFLLAGLMLAADYWLLYRSKSVACQPGGACHPSHPFGRWMRRVYVSSVSLYALGLTAAYLLLPVARLLGF